tara:strand:+ start:268 stop:564 length:297 start_codon:yes stop_codon:yes gene_type:complete
MLKIKRNITKDDLSIDVFRKIGISQNLSNRIINDLIISIIDILIQNKKLNLKNIGSFKIINKRERVGRNPKTRKIYRINAMRVVSFKPSIQLKKALNK